MVGLALLETVFKLIPLSEAMPTLCPKSQNLTDSANEVRKLAANQLPLIQAGLLLYIDDLDGSHERSQSIESDEGSYWHGIMHRREGDFWNSKYWFRRAGSLPSNLGLDPATLTDQFEKCSGQNPDDLVTLQREEWARLMTHCLDISGAAQ